VGRKQIAQHWGRAPACKVARRPGKPFAGRQFVAFEVELNSPVAHPSLGGCAWTLLTGISPFDGEMVLPERYQQIAKCVRGSSSAVTDRRWRIVWPSTERTQFPKPSVAVVEDMLLTPSHDYIEKRGIHDVAPEGSREYRTP